MAYMQRSLMIAKPELAEAHMRKRIVCYSGIRPMSNTRRLIRFACETYLTPGIPRRNDENERRARRGPGTRCGRLFEKDRRPSPRNYSRDGAFSSSLERTESHEICPVFCEGGTENDDAPDEDEDGKCLANIDTLHHPVRWLDTKTMSGHTDEHCEVRRTHKFADQICDVLEKTWVRTTSMRSPGMSTHEDGGKP